MRPADKDETATVEDCPQHWVIRHPNGVGFMQRKRELNNSDSPMSSIELNLVALCEVIAASRTVPECGALDMSLAARLKDAEDDVLRLHKEKMKFFERTIELERELAAEKLARGRAVAHGTAMAAPLSARSFSTKDAEEAIDLFFEPVSTSGALPGLQEVLRFVSEKAIKYHGTNESYYCHGLWQVSEWVKQRIETLSATRTPSVDAEAKYCPHGFDTRLECSKCRAARGTSVREQLDRLGPPCPKCSGFGIKAWHPDNECPSASTTAQ